MGLYMERDWMVITVIDYRAELFKYSVSHDDICERRKLQISNGKHTNRICFVLVLTPTNCYI